MTNRPWFLGPWFKQIWLLIKNRKTTFSGNHPTKDFNHEDTDEWNTFMGLLERASFCHPNCPKDIESLYTKRSVLNNPFFDKLSVYE